MIVVAVVVVKSLCFSTSGRVIATATKAIINSVSKTSDAISRNLAHLVNKKKSIFVFD